MKFKLVNEEIYNGEKRKFFTDGEKTVKLKPGDEIPDGFYPGRTFNVNTWNKGLTAETDPRVKANSDAAHATLRQKQYPAWNKGLTKDTDERVAKNWEHTHDTIKNKYGVDNISQYVTQQDDYQVWNKGLTKETDDRMKKASDNHKGATAWNKGISIPGHPHTQETKDKLRIIHTDPDFKEKRYQTMKANGTLNVQDSKAEQQFYQKLLERYSYDDIVRQYFDKERYPFRCDFYIISEDKFIEIHANWTHGGRPYDPNDEFCQMQLEAWQEKAKTSQYYQNAIYTWTVLDVKKLETARKNNLNFDVIYC